MHILHNSTAVDTEQWATMNDDHLVYFECLPLFVGETLLARAKQRKSVDLLRSGQQPGTGDLGLPVHTGARNETYSKFLQSWRRLLTHCK